MDASAKSYSCSISSQISSFKIISYLYSLITFLFFGWYPLCFVCFTTTNVTFISTTLLLILLILPCWTDMVLRLWLMHYCSKSCFKYNRSKIFGSYSNIQHRLMNLRSSWTNKSNFYLYNHLTLWTFLPGLSKMVSAYIRFIIFSYEPISTGFESQFENR